MRRMGMITTLALLVCGCWASSDMILKPVPVIAAAHQDARHIDKEFRVPMGKRLDIDLRTGGSLDISGWDNEVVKVDAILGGRDGEDCKVDFNESSSGLEIHSYYDGGRRNYSTNLRFEIKVPRRIDLNIDSMGGGVKITSVEGIIDGKTMGGELDLSNLKGEINLTTMGGKITLLNSDVNGRVHTMGGRVLLQDVTGNVKGSSMGGNVIYKNITNRAGVSTGDEVRISSMGGAIKVDTAPAGADVSTMGGDIIINSAARFIKAKTMGGNIHIGAIDGWVRATTMGGSVAVTMTGDPAQGQRDVTLSSNGGDITLTVPAGLSMDLDVEIAYTSNRKRDYQIISDFDIQRSETGDWDDSQGTPRKYIYGKGSIAGGKNRVTIRTINGDVYLKKG